MKLHWHLGYSNKTACGILVYPTKMAGEYDTAANGRVLCKTLNCEVVTCERCQKVMRLGKWARQPIAALRKEKEAER